MEKSGKIRKGWTTGYFTVPDSIFEAPISPYAKLVYMYLCRRADSNGQSYPGYGRTAQDTGLSRRTVIRAIAELIEHGLIEKDFRGRKSTGEYWHNEYTIIHPNDAIQKEGSDSVTLLPPGGSSVTQALGSDCVALPSATVALGSATVAPEGQHPKDNPSKDNPSKDTHTKFEEENRKNKKEENRVCEEVRGELEKRGISVTKKIVQKWLLTRTKMDIIEAAEMAMQEGVRNPGAYITAVMHHGVIRTEKRTEKGNRQGTKSETQETRETWSRMGQAVADRNKKYAAFYALIDEARGVAAAQDGEVSIVDTK